MTTTLTTTQDTTDEQDGYPVDLAHVFDDEDDRNSDIVNAYLDLYV